MDIVKLQKYSFKKLLILMSALFLLVFVINSIASYIDIKYKNGYAQRMEVNLKGSSIDSGKPLKFGDLSSLELYLPTASFSYMTEQEGSISTKNKGYAIKSVKAGEGLNKFIGLKMARGTFFSDEQYKYGRNVAVISEEMAYKLFTSHHVIGNEIRLSGEKYRVVGVYKNEKSILSLLVSDGIEIVYIPFRSGKSNTVNTLFIKDEKLMEDSFRVTNLEKILKERLKLDTYLYKINDFYNSSVFSNQPLSMFNFLVGVLCICILIKYFIKYLNFGFEHLKGGIRDYYLLEILLKWKLKILVFIMGGALILGFIVVIFYSIVFKGYVPYEFIPPNNVFDFSFYTEKITVAINEINSNRGYLPTLLELLNSNNLKIIYLLIILLVINFILVLGEIKLNSLVLQSIKKQITALGCSIIIGFAIAFILCLIIGVNLVFPIKATVILVIYFCVYLSKGYINRNKMPKSAQTNNTVFIKNFN